MSKLLTLFLLLCLLTACSQKKVSILYNAPFSKAHDVRIDDTLQLRAKFKKDYAKKQISAGEHTLTIDGKPAGIFEANEDEGILNIAREEFVIFPIEFRFGDGFPLGATKGMPNALIVHDSF